MPFMKESDTDNLEMTLLLQPVSFAVLHAMTQSREGRIAIDAIAARLDPYDRAQIQSLILDSVSTTALNVTFKLRKPKTTCFDSSQLPKFSSSYEEHNISLIPGEGFWESGAAGEAALRMEVTRLKDDIEKMRQEILRLQNTVECQRVSMEEKKYLPEQPWQLDQLLRPSWLLAETAEGGDVKKNLPMNFSRQMDEQWESFYTSDEATAIRQEEVALPAPALLEQEGPLEIVDLDEKWLIVRTMLGTIHVYTYENGEPQDRLGVFDNVAQCRDFFQQSNTTVPSIDAPIWRIVK